MTESVVDDSARRAAEILGINAASLQSGTILASLANVNPDDKYRKKVELLSPSAALPSP